MSEASRTAVAGMREPGIARRERILDMAEALFAEHGFHGATLSRIAEASGLGNAGLIHHFPSKARLYRTVLEQVAADLDARLARALAGAGEPGERLHAFLQVQADWSIERPQAFRLLQRELIDNRERMASARALPLTGFVETGVTIVAEAQAAGLLAPGPAEVRLNQLIGTLTYAALVHPTFRQMMPRQAAAGPLADERGWMDAVARDLATGGEPGTGQS